MWFKTPIDSSVLNPKKVQNKATKPLLKQHSSCFGRHPADKSESEEASVKHLQSSLANVGMGGNTWIHPPTKIFLKPVKSCKFSIIFRCPQKNGQLTISLLWSFRCLNSQLIDMPTVNCQLPSLFPCRTSSFHPEVLERIHTSIFTAIFTVPSVSVRVVFRKNFLIKYLFAVKMPLNKYRRIWGPVRCWIREKNTWYIVTVCKLSSNETTWSQNQGGFQSQIPPGIHQKFALRAALCSSNSSCVLGPRHALLPLQSPSAQRIQTALRLKDVKPTRPQHLFYREGV